MESSPLSSHQLLEILSLSENATAIYTTENIIIQTANDAMLRFWGKDRSIIGKPLGEAVPEFKDQPFIAMLQKVLKTGITDAGDAIPATTRVDGKLKTAYYAYEYRAIKDASGTPYAILHTASDVTDRYLAKKVAEESRQKVILLNEELTTANEELKETQALRATAHTKLQENEHRLQSILDTMAEGVGIIDATGQMIYANQMAQKILGLTLSEITKRTYHDPKWENLRLDGTPLPATEHPMYIMMSTGKPVYDCEIGLQPLHKERLYISINAAPLYDAEGNINGGIGTFMDVTGRRKDLQQKDDFISIASHELKTPITTLKASLQLLDRMKEAPSPKLLPKLVDQCNRSMDKITNLVDELLETSKIAQGGLQLHKTTFTVAEMLNKCCNHVRMAGTHELIMEGDDKLEVCADEHRIDQVVVNLVNNAVKYAPDSKIIYLIVEHIDGMAKVSVKDNGPGIPPEKIPHLFKRYYQVDSSSSSKKSGLGLGLYICSEIIAKHGGKIGVDSELGEGSTFWFTLPIS